MGRYGAKKTQAYNLTKLKTQHTEKDFGLADAALFSNQFRFALSPRLCARFCARFCARLCGFVFTACGPFWQAQNALPNQSLNVAFGFTAHCVGRPLARH